MSNSTPNGDEPFLSGYAGVLNSLSGYEPGLGREQLIPLLVEGICRYAAVIGYSRERVQADHRLVNEDLLRHEARQQQEAARCILRARQRLSGFPDEAVDCIIGCVEKASFSRKVQVFIELGITLGLLGAAHPDVRQIVIDRGVRWLESGDGGLLCAGVRALSKIAACKNVADDRLVPALCAVVDRAPASDRIPVVTALAYLSTPALLDVFLGLLNDPQAKVRAEALRGIGKIIEVVPRRHAEITDVVGRMLVDQPAQVRTRAAEALVYSKDDSSVRYLKTAAFDGSPVVRNAATWALGQLEKVD